MAGLDFLLGAQGDDQNAARMGLLAAGLGMLGNNTGHYGAFGPAAAAGGMQGLQAYQAVQDNALQDKYRKAQLAQLEQATAKQRAQLDWLTGGGQPAAAAPANTSPAGLPTFQPPMTFGMNGYGQAPQTAPQASRGGLLSRSPEDFALGAVLGVPGIDKAWDIYKANKEGVKRDPGATYRDLTTGEETYVPKLDNNLTLKNGVVSALPGSVQATEALSGATARGQEGAKAGLDLVFVDLGDGRKVQMPRNQAAALLGGQGRFAGGSGEFGGFGVTPNPVSQNSANAVNDNFLKNSYQPAIDSGRSASDMLANITALRSIPLETGWGTDHAASAANVLTSLGIAPKSAEALAANSQKFQSVAMDRLMTTLKAQVGPQTEGDAQRAGNTFAKLSNRPEANQFILDLAQAKAAQDQRKAAFYEAALPMAQKSGDLQRIDREWRKIQGSIWNDPILQKWGGK